LDLSEVHEAQEAMLPAARELIKRGLTLGKGKKALAVAAMCAALEETGNNQSAAARLLAISQGTISVAVTREPLLSRFIDTRPGPKKAEK
jgi:hypothetical protein